MLGAENQILESAIRCGGLAKTKAARIKCMLKELMERRGDFSLEYLHDLPIDEVKAELSRFKGIGPKTVSLFEFILFSPFSSSSSSSSFVSYRWHVCLCSISSRMISL